MLLDILLSMVHNLIQKTAWPMEPPAPWSSFHIIFSLCGFFVAGIVAFFLSNYYAAKTELSLDSSDSNASKNTPKKLFCLPGIQILWICGLILAVSEIYKQLFLYEVINQKHYDWWYFPFQLCSTPMYLCLLLPVFSVRLQKAAAVYLESFGFLGGIMALAEPSGLMHPYWILTLHGFLWHILLIFLGFFCAGLNFSKKEEGVFSDSLALFFIFCFIATLINIFTRGKSDMFYISPYYPITQIVFHQISLTCGILPGIVIYLLSICVGAFFCYKLLTVIFQKQS